MARFNRFGATFDQVQAMYPGAALADFDDGGAAGQTAIEAVLDRITRDVSAAMSPEVYRQMTQVDCQEVVRYATAGQTTATLGLVPVLAGTVHLWVYPNPELGVGDQWARKPRLGVNEVSGAAVDAATGAITGLALQLGDRLYASYDVNVDHADFEMPSVADLVVLGAAAELGARLYSHDQQEWKLVDEYRERYRGRYVVQEGGTMGMARLGQWIPDELRALTYWRELERASDEIRSVRLYRG